MYLIRLALRPWRVALGSQILSSVAVGFMLMLSALLIWLQYSLKPVIKEFEDEQVVTAYLNPEVQEGSEKRLVDSIRVAVGSSAKVQLMSAVNFLEQLKGGYPELYRELSSLGTEAAAIVPRYVSIVGNVEGGLIGKIRQIPGIESVESSKDRHIPVVGAFKALRWISRMIVLGIAFALLAGLFQLSRMNRQLHKDSISLLRSWGASPFATKAPVLLSSILVGSLGGILAAVAWWILGDQFFEHTRNLAPVFARLESPPFWIGPAVLGMGSLLGFISGIVDDA